MVELNATCLFLLYYLFLITNPFFFSRARFYAAEIASAIGYLHSLQIIYRLGNFFRHNHVVTSFLFSSLIWNFFFSSYRDLKPENILLDGRVSGVFAFYACINPQVYFKVMLHGTIPLLHPYNSFPGVNNFDSRDHICWLVDQKLKKD